ncbi:MAG: hypothetical protein IJT94_03990 [Oscillibacter sp.]|nr:hypothetical protein [Oscillibacter sp.]
MAEDKRNEREKRAMTRETTGSPAEKTGRSGENRRTNRRANCGESLIETMFALLVGSLSVMLLATMISASAKIIRLSGENADSYTENLNSMNRPTESGTAEILYDTNGDGTIGESDGGDTVLVRIGSFLDARGRRVISYDTDSGSTPDEEEDGPEIEEIPGEEG